MNVIPVFVKDIFTASGPEFLLFYAVFYAVLFFGALCFLRQLDSSQSLPPLEPPEERPNPYEFAALRSGRHEIVRLFLFELVASGLIELTKDKNGKVTKQSKLRRTKKIPDDVPDLSPEGRTFVNWFHTEQETQSVFAVSPLESLARQWAQKFNDRFEAEHLVLRRWERYKGWFICWSVLILFLGVGLTRWIVAKQPAIIFLFFGMVGGLVATLAYLTPPKLSYRGKKYVRAVQKNFPTPLDSDSTSDLIFAAGIMGIPSFASTPFADFATLFTPTGGGGCGGCGGGCSGGCGGGCSGCGGCGD